MEDLCRGASDKPERRSWMPESWQLSHSLPPPPHLSRFLSDNSFSLPKPLNFTCWMLESSQTFTFSSSFFDHLSTFLSYYSKSLPKPPNFTSWMPESCQLSHSLPPSVRISLLFFLTTVFLYQNLSTLHSTCQMFESFQSFFAHLSTFLSYYSKSLPKPLNFTCWMLVSCQLSHSLPPSLLISLFFFLTTVNL